MDIAGAPCLDTAVRPRAITFAPEVFRAWCGASSRRIPGETNAESAAIDGTYDSFESDDHPGRIVRRTLQSLRTVDSVWRTADGVGPVAIWCTSDDEGSDGGAVITVAVDGVDLSAGHHSAEDLVPGRPDPDGRVRMMAEDAAVLALIAVAAAVNAAVARHRSSAAAGQDLPTTHLIAEAVSVPACPPERRPLPQRVELRWTVTKSHRQVVLAEDIVDSGNLYPATSRASFDPRERESWNAEAFCAEIEDDQTYFCTDERTVSSVRVV